MCLKKIKILSVFGIFLLTSLFHFIYVWFPNSFTSIFFPVNESVWEHMKLLYTTIIVWSIMEYFLIKRFDITANNFLLSTFMSAFLIIPIFLSLYLPIYFNTNHSLPITLFIMFVAISIVEFISYFIQKRNDIKILNIISLFLIIFGFIIFGYLTYFPLKNELFFDENEGKYGINTYYI